MIFTAYSDNTDGLFGISLKSCGHIFAQKGRRISRPGGREDWLLFYVVKGEESFSLEREVVAHEGSFIFFRPNEKQEHIYVGEKTGEFYYVHFLAPKDFDLFGFESSVVYSSKPCTRVRDLFEGIINELQTKQLCYQKICTSMLFDIIVTLARRTADLNDPHRKYSSQISSVIQIMNREYGKNTSLDEYAEICKMSKFHFSRVFKEITGDSPLEYRNKIRIEHAKEMLENAEVSVSDIGCQIGYTSPQYFCDAFKKKTGLSPTQYRKKFNIKQD